MDDTFLGQCWDNLPYSAQSYSILLNDNLKMQSHRAPVQNARVLRTWQRTPRTRLRWLWDNLPPYRAATASSCACLAYAIWRTQKHRYDLPARVVLGLALRLSAGANTPQRSVAHLAIPSLRDGFDLAKQSERNLSPSPSVGRPFLCLPPCLLSCT